MQTRGKKLSAQGISASFAAKSILFREAAAEREEIMRHKWFLSERAGYDVGYFFAMYDWIANHRAEWRKFWRKENTTGSK